MGKIIITSEDVSDIDAVRVVANVIADGLVSNNNTQYCYISKFTHGITVYADKTKTGTHTFRANVSQDKAAHLISLIERLQVSELLLRLSRDKRLISTGQYAKAVELTPYGSPEDYPDMDEDGEVHRKGWHYERDSEGEFESIVFDMNVKVAH